MGRLLSAFQRLERPNLDLLDTSVKISAKILGIPAFSS